MLLIIKNFSAQKNEMGDNFYFLCGQFEVMRNDVKVGKSVSKKVFMYPLNVQLQYEDSDMTCDGLQLGSTFQKVQYMEK